MKRLPQIFSCLIFLQIVLAVCIGLFPFVYYAMGFEFGVVSTKGQSVLKNSFWAVAFHTHIIFAGVSLVTGWPQFVAKLRNRKPLLHKTLGKIYIFSSLLSAAAAVYWLLCNRSCDTPLSTRTQKEDDTACHYI